MTRLRLLSEWYGGSLGSLVRTQDQLWSRYLSRMGLASAMAAFTNGWEFNTILGWLRVTEDQLEVAANLLLAVPGDGPL